MLFQHVGLPHHHPGSRSIDLVEPMRAAMTPEIRMTILWLKEHFQDPSTVSGVDIYRAVIDGDVR